MAKQNKSDSKKPIKLSPKRKLLCVGIILSGILIICALAYFFVDNDELGVNPNKSAVLGTTTAAPIYDYGVTCSKLSTDSSIDVIHFAFKLKLGYGGVDAFRISKYYNQNLSLSKNGPLYYYFDARSKSGNLLDIDNNVAPKETKYANTYKKSLGWFKWNYDVYIYAKRYYYTVDGKTYYAANSYYTEALSLDEEELGVQTYENFTVLRTMKGYSICS